jgi:hypothetical protein
VFDLITSMTFLQILELRDCKRSVKKDILDECRGSWEEPEPSDDEATYALVCSGVDIDRIPSGCEKFTMFEECSTPGSWPEWKERRDKERRDRFTALKSRKESALLRKQDLEKESDLHRREASMAAHLRALEDAKRVAKERARDAENSKSLLAKSVTSSPLLKAKLAPSDSVPQDDIKSSDWSRTEADLTLSQLRGLQKWINVAKLPATQDSPGKGIADDAAAAPAQLSASSSAPVKETMKEKIARQKRESELAAASTARTTDEALVKVVQEPVIESSNSGKETLKEKIARQKREAEMAASAPSTPTMAPLDADSPMRARSDSSTGKETLKEKIARAKREAELAATSPSGPATGTPTSSAASPDTINADDGRPRSSSSVVKETLKERIARQKLEAAMAADSPNAGSEAAPPAQPAVSSVVISGLAARRGSTAFLRSIQRSPGNKGDC